MRMLVGIAQGLLCAAGPALVAAGVAEGGPFGGAAAGIASDDPRIVGWATGVVSLVRGPQQAGVVGSPPASFGQGEYALGPADATSDFTRVVSLGDGGSIELSFAAPISDGPGPDLAVFENSFAFGGVVFAELAFVEVSSNGVDFFRFPAVSLTQTLTQKGPFDGLDPTDVRNLAGDQVAGFGTPLDLAELDGVSPLLDVSSVTRVRIVDVVGSLDGSIGSVDSRGAPVNDPFPTASAGGGFDLDAVAVLRVPEPATAVLGLAACSLLGRRRGA